VSGTVPYWLTCLYCKSLVSHNLGQLKLAIEYRLSVYLVQSPELDVRLVGQWLPDPDPQIFARIRIISSTSNI
jgi:hypothetical protein